MSQAAESVEVLIKFVPQKTELVLDGYKYVIAGSSDNMMYLNGMIQINMDTDTIEYMHKIEKAKEKGDYTEVDKYGDKIITIKKNLYILDKLIEKMESNTFKNKKNILTKIIKNGRGKFEELEIPKQVTIILDIINNMYGIKPDIDLRAIGGKAEGGKCRASRKIDKYAEVRLITKSCTGLFERQIDLLKI